MLGVRAKLDFPGGFFSEFPRDFLVEIFMHYVEREMERCPVCVCRVVLTHNRRFRLSLPGEERVLEVGEIWQEEGGVESF